MIFMSREHEKLSQQRETNERSRVVYEVVPLWCCRYGDTSGRRRTPKVLIGQLPVDDERSYFEIGNYY